jgi:hypothetical protein
MLHRALVIFIDDAAWNAHSPLCETSSAHGMAVAVIIHGSILALVIAMAFTPLVVITIAIAVAMAHQVIQVESNGRRGRAASTMGAHLRRRCTPLLFTHKLTHSLLRPIDSAQVLERRGWLLRCCPT